VLIPEPALVALIGAAGSGKSTVARAFPAGWRLELDALRAMAADSPGDQSATPVAVSVFRALLDARLERHLPVLVDSTNSDAAVRAHLLQRARTWSVPSVAILVDCDLETCLARQAGRAPDKRVPDHVVAAQHAAVPSREQLLAEGWDHVHDAAGIDLLHLAIQRAATAAADPDPLNEIRVLFGTDLAAAFTYTDQHHEHGRFTIAGRDIELRYTGGEPYDRPWQARIGGTCDCGGDLWVHVDNAADLLAAYRGEPDDEAVCAQCDDVLFAGQNTATDVTSR
jgi:predicted kinase